MCCMLSTKDWQQFHGGGGHLGITTNIQQTSLIASSHMDERDSNPQRTGTSVYKSATLAARQRAQRTEMHESKYTLLYVYISLSKVSCKFARCKC